MAKDFEKEEFLSFYIPENYDDSGKILDLFDKRKLIEGAIFAIAPAYGILMLQPFKEQMTNFMVILFVCAPIFLLCAFGINGDPITIFLKNVSSYLKNKKHYKMRFKRIDKKPAKKKSKGKSTQQRKTASGKNVNTSRTKSASKPRTNVQSSAKPANKSTSAKPAGSNSRSQTRPKPNTSANARAKPSTSTKSASNTKVQRKGNQK